MPFWLQKLLFGAQRLEYIIMRASGRTLAGSMEVASRTKDRNLLRKVVEREMSAPGDPALFVQVDSCGTTAGLLDDFPRIARMLRPV